MMRNFFERFFGSKRSQRPARRCRPLQQAVEFLEQRALLATLTISDAQAVESDGQMTFTVTLNGAAPGAFYAAIVTENKPGAAHPASNAAFSEGGDYVSAGHMLSFDGTAGQTKTFTVTLNNDNRVEYTEEFQARVGTIFGSGVDGVGNTGTGSITNDDSATIWLLDDVTETAYATANEGNSLSPGKVTFFVRSSAPIDELLSVEWSTSDGSAIAGEDYVADLGSLPFGLYGEGYYTSDVDFKGDARVETLLEDFRVNLGAITLSGGGSCPLPVTVAASGYLLSRIQDEDTAEVTLLPISPATEGTHVSRQITVELTGTVDTSFSVLVSTAAGTAFGGQDYNTLAAHALTFSGTNGEQQLCAVTIIDDNVVEASTEDFSVYLHDPLNLPAGYAGRITVNPGGAIRTVTITDDDIAALSINDQSAPEEMPSGAMRILYFTVTLSKPFDQDMTLHYELYGQTASASDVVNGFGSRSVNIAAGATSVTIQVNIVQDGIYEADETFVVDLQDLVPTIGTSPRAFTFTDDEGIGTIQNNDPQP